MSLLRDYSIIALPPNEARSEVVNMVGTFITIRRTDENVNARIKAFDAVQGGTLLIDVLISTGDKIRTADKFKRIEVTNVGALAQDIIITAGDGNFETDSVAGTVAISGIVPVSENQRSFVTQVSHQTFDFDAVIYAVPSPLCVKNTIINNTDDVVYLFDTVVNPSFVNDGYPLPVGEIFAFDSTVQFAIHGKGTNGLIHWIQEGQFDAP